MNRCKEATKLIAKRYWGVIEMTHQEIAIKCQLAKSTVKQLTANYRKEQEAYL